MNQRNKVEHCFTAYFLLEPSGSETPDVKEKALVQKSEFCESDLKTFNVFYLGLLLRSVACLEVQGTFEILNFFRRLTSRALGLKFLIMLLTEQNGLDNTFKYLLQDTLKISI